MNTEKIPNSEPVKYEFAEIEQPIAGERLFIQLPMLDLDLTKRYSYADYLTWMDERRRELIDGFIHLLSAPNELHERLRTNWSFFIGLFIRKRKGKCRVYHAPFDVRLPLEGAIEDNQLLNVVQPDICVICDLSKIDAKGCLGAPDLVVEVLSPSTEKIDKTKKFTLYEKAGVCEYWMVDPKEKKVNVFLIQSDGKYNAGTVYECNQKAPVHIFKGLEIDLQELFED